MGKNTGASCPLRGARECEYLPTFHHSIFISIPSQLDVSAIVPSLLQEREAQFEEAVAEGGETVVSDDL